jgi:cytochrome c oxidase subunit 1
MAPLQMLVTIAAIVTISGQVVFLANLFWSLWKGPKAEANPWECTTLEWTMPSPAPQQGFGDHRPRVNHGPYEYGDPGLAADFVMQDARLK